MIFCILTSNRHLFRWWCWYRNECLFRHQLSQQFRLEMCLSSYNEISRNYISEKIFKFYSWDIFICWEFFTCWVTVALLFFTFVLFINNFVSYTNRNLAVDFKLKSVNWTRKRTSNFLVIKSQNIFTTKSNLKCWKPKSKK